MTLARILNDEGLQRFEAYISAVREDVSLPPPMALLTDGQFSDPFSPDVEVENRQFADAYEFGVYLNETFARCEPREISRNYALWSWLALFFFDDLTKLNGGQQKVLEKAVYILDPSFTFQRYYRHAVRAPWQAVLKHGERAKILLLAVGRGTRTEFAEQLGARPDIFGCTNVIAAAYQMYFDETAQKPRSGASGKGPGSPRRLTAVVRQLQLTYDLEDCSITELLGLLPKEFDRWVRMGQTAQR